MQTDFDECGEAEALMNFLKDRGLTTRQAMVSIGIAMAMLVKTQENPKYEAAYFARALLDEVKHQ